MIAEKYRYLHPSMVGTIDLFTTSNSDCGMSGSITPFVQLYDGFFFTPNKEPCLARYNFEKALYEDEGINRKLKLDTFEEYIADITKKNAFKDALAYEVIEIVEKDTSSNDNANNNNTVTNEDPLDDTVETMEDSDDVLDEVEELESDNSSDD